MPSRKPKKPPSPNATPAQVKRAGMPLTLAEVRAIAPMFAKVGTRAGTARALGIGLETVNRYLDRGDPRRGIPPILQGGTVVPVNAPVGVATPPAATHPPPAPVPPPVAPPGGLYGPPPVPSPLPTPQGVAALVPGPMGPSTALDHTVPVANTELVRASRNARNLFNLRNRIVAKLADRLRAEDGKAQKTAPRLTPSERDLLMVVREMRVTAFDVAKLYSQEVVILGVNANVPAPKGESDDPSAEGLGANDAATIDELRGQLSGLLADPVNLQRRGARGR